MSAQFIHIETYARESKTWSGKDKKGNAKGGTTKSIKEIVAETDREPGNCPHVEQPLPPVTLYGVDAGKIPAMCEEYAATMKDGAGRKLAKTGLVCIAGVVSVGSPDAHKWEQVKQDSIDFLKEKYGDRLKSVVEHKDEAFQHFHFYVIPRPGEKLEDIHEGLKARNTARAEGLKAGTQNRRYREAMKGLQDAYSLKVSAKNGLTRIGPSRRRLSRDGWRAEQAAADDLANKLALYEDTKKVAGKAWKNGLQKGFEKGRAQGLASVSGLGDKVGTFFRSLLGPLHKPTAQVAKELEEAKEQIAKEKLAKIEAEKKAKAEKEEADRRVKEVAKGFIEQKKEQENQGAPEVQRLQKALNEEVKTRQNAELEKQRLEQFAKDQVDKNNALRARLNQYERVKS